MAFIRRRELRWKECAAFLEQVLAIDPRNVKALSRLASFLENFRHFDRALEVQEQLMQVQPHDLSVQCTYHEIVYRRSGSWASFDKWRSALPAGAERSSVDVHLWDIARASARRDFDEVLRLLGSPPDCLPVEQRELLSLWTSVAHLVKGDRQRAMETARIALGELTTKLQHDPGNEFLRMVASEYHAVLGEREAALAELRRAHESALAHKDLLSALSINRLLVFVYAYLGDREKTLQELPRILKLPSYFSGHWFRIDWRLASLWDDPAFQAIVSDPVHNAPLSFDLKDSYALGELQTPLTPS
jgi:tetratricopeptide (TPR) repeat protein